MKSFLQKLDRKAAAWINAMDSELQPPVVQVLTGDVFTHGTESPTDTIPAAPVLTTPSQQIQARPVANPVRETARVSTRALHTGSPVRQS